MAEKKRIRYEDRIELVDNEIRKRRPKWRLSSLNWIDFDDVSQIIRAHLAKKWDQWDQSRPLLPWVNKIISNQFKNILRNYYHNFAKPCVGCPLNNSLEEGENSCSFTKTKVQDTSCPLYKKWSKSKKHACDIKIPVSIENLCYEINSETSFNDNLDRNIENFHEEMKKELNEKQYNIYKMLFIDDLSEEEIALKLGYKTSEVGRKAGYKQIKNIKAKMKQIGEKLLKKKDIIL
jgi:RNA polymerase sigma factor (sigma-70 family)